MLKGAVYFAIHKSGAGHLCVTPNFVGFANAFNPQTITINIRHIVSLNKTKYSFLPGSGHSFEILTVTKELQIFRLYARDDAVRTIVDQAKSMRPAHAILVLNQGEPLL